MTMKHKKLMVLGILSIFFIAGASAQSFQQENQISQGSEAVDVDASDNHVAIGGSTARVYNYNDGSQVSELSVISDVTGLEYFNSGTQLAAGTSGLMRTYTDSYGLDQSNNGLADRAVGDISVSPDQNHLAYKQVFNYPEVLNPSDLSNDCVIFSGNNDGLAIEFSPDSSEVATTSGNSGNSIVLANPDDCSTGTTLYNGANTGTDQFNGFDYTDNGEYLAAVNADQELIVFDMSDNSIAWQNSDATDRLQDVVVAEQENLIVSAGWDGTLRAYDISTGNLVDSTSTGFGQIDSMGYDNGVLAISSPFDSTKIYSFSSPPSYSYEITGTNSPVQDGNTLEVDYNVTNSGGAGTLDVSLAWKSTDNIVDTDTGVSVPSGGSATGTLTFDTTGEGDVTDFVQVGRDSDDDGNLNEVSGSQEVTIFTLPSPNVETNAAASTGVESITFEGNVTDMDGESEYTGYFRYREQGTTTWQDTDTNVSITGTGTYQIQQTGLQRDTTYEYVAALYYDESNPTIDTGNIQTATAESPSGTITYNTGTPDDGATFNYDKNVIDVEVGYGYNFPSQDGELALFVDGSQVTEYLDIPPSPQTMSFNIGANETKDYYAELRYDDGTIVDTTPTRTVSTDAPDNNIVQSSPADGQSFSSSTNEVQLAVGLDTEESGTLRYYVDGTMEESRAVSSGSSTQYYNHPVSSDSSYNWYAEFEGDTTGLVNQTGTRTFSVEAEPLTIQTDAATGITVEGAVLNGEVTSLGSYSSAEANFEIREQGESGWTSYSSGSTTLSSPSTFSWDINSDSVTLDPDTTYEFRAFADYNGETAYGSINTFTTDQNQINSVTVDSPADGTNYEFYQKSNNQIDWTVDAIGNYTTTLTVDGTQIASKSGSGTESFSTTHSFNHDQATQKSYTIEASAESTSDSISVSTDAPRHTASLVTPTSDQLLMTGNSIQVEYDYQYETGEQVSLERPDGTTTTRTCSDTSTGLCSETLTGTESYSQATTNSYTAEVTGSTSGLTDTSSTKNVQWYEPSYNLNRYNGALISYPDRDTVSLEATWQSSEENADATLVLNGNPVNSTTLSSGETVTFDYNSNDFTIGQNNWSVEFTGQTSGDTVTSSTDMFEIQEPDNSIENANPADGTEFDSDTSTVDLDVNYSTEENATIEWYYDGSLQASQNVDAETSGTLTETVNVNSGTTHEWYAVFKGSFEEITTPTYNFTVLEETLTADITSPANGAVFNWSEREQTITFESSANQEYNALLDIDGSTVLNNNYNRGSNTDTYTEEFGDPTQDVTYQVDATTVGLGTGTEDSDSISFTVEQPELQEDVSLDFPQDGDNFGIDSNVTFEATATTNDIADFELYVNGTMVANKTIGDADRTNTATETLYFSKVYNTTGNVTYHAELDGQSTETRTIKILPESLNVDYTSPVDATLREGIRTVNYQADVETTSGGTVFIVENGEEVYNESITVDSSPDTNSISASVQSDGEAGEDEWRIKFQPDGSNETLTASNKASYEIEKLPSANLQSPQNGAFFRDLPTTVSHEFSFQDKVNDIEYTLYINGIEAGTGVVEDTSASEDIQYGENEAGENEWYVNATWENQNNLREGIETQSRNRTYNTGDPTVVEGGIVDQTLNSVADFIGVGDTSARILITLFASILIGVGIMAATQSVGYAALGTFGTFFTIGVIGFMPDTFTIILGVLAVGALTVGAWRLMFGGDE